MSGGGGGGGGGFVPTSPVGGGARKPGSEDPCDLLLTLPLSAVQHANAAKVTVGMVLDLELRKNRGVDTVVAVNPSDNSVVGAVAYRDVQALIDCINGGNEYLAKVLQHAATSVKVQIAKK
jgi:hypothetical protein